VSDLRKFATSDSRKFTSSDSRKFAASDSKKFAQYTPGTLTLEISPKFPDEFSLNSNSDKVAFRSPNYAIDRTRKQFRIANLLVLTASLKYISFVPSTKLRI
jgi:hypothetical protein